MSALTRETFPEFFATVNGGHAPFPWQQRCFDYIVDHGEWPAAITAPTGAGKSAVVDMHIFATALYAVGEAPRLPRRLCVVVNRRALVDSQFERARRILEWLNDSEDELANAMRQALLSLRSDHSSDPFVLTNLRGGLPTDRRWIDDPGACSVICATPDMWGSRLLFRGYGTSMAARPREAGLLGLDAVTVIDESHLSRQLLASARWVAQHNTPFAKKLGVPNLQVVESSATAQLIEGQQPVGINDEDLDHPGLEPRMRNPKHVQLFPSSSWTGNKASSAYIKHLVNLVKELREGTTGGTVGCIVNRVDTAIRVAEQLGSNTPCWVGRLRPLDLDRVKEQFPELLGVDRDSDQEPPQFLVATQTVEVGVDLDLHALVTELAPGDALAQRFGRVNRRGLRPSAAIWVVVPEDETAITDQLPYTKNDLRAAFSWLQTFNDQNGVSPNAIRLNPAPSTTPERPHIKYPHVGDVMRWEATDDLMMADEAMELWIRDSIEPEQSQVGLVIRRGIPEDIAVALPLLQAVPPTDREVFPCSLVTMRNLLKKLSKDEKLSYEEEHRIFLFRNEDVLLCNPDPESGVFDIRPGDVFIVDPSLPFTRAKVVVEDAKRPEDLEAVWGDEETEVIIHPEQNEGTLPSDHVELLDSLSGLEPDDAQKAFSGSGHDGFLTLGPKLADDGLLPWIVIKKARLLADDEATRQVWTSSQNQVTLDQHQHGVADRAHRVGQSLDLDEHLIDVLKLAGLHHDDGKKDLRFQKYRLDNQDDVILAKSNKESAEHVMLRRNQEGLPRGWRHELRSVAEAWPHLVANRDHELVARLIGTSHGHGRMLPQAGAETLMTDQDSPELQARVQDLFIHGEWSELMRRTSEEYGAWGCAYLEAALRAADCQVSKEGS